MASSIKQRLLAGGSWVIVGKALTSISNILVLSLLSRILSTSGFAAFGVSQRLVLIVSRVAPLGLHQAVVRLVAEARGAGRPGRARTAIKKVYIGATLGAAAVAVALYAGFGNWLIRVLVDSTAVAASVSALVAWAVVLAYQILVSETFRGFEDLKLATLFGGVISGVATLLALLVLQQALGTLHVEQVIVVMVLSVGVSTAVGMLLVQRKARALGPPEPTPTGSLVRLSLPLWVSGVTVFLLTQSDVLILGVFAADADVAAYYGAAQLVNLVSQPLILINLVVPPFIAELYFSGQKQSLQKVLRHTATLAGVPAFIVLVAFVLFGGPILSLVLGEGAEAGAMVLAILSVGKLIDVWTGSCGVTMNMTGHQTPLMVVMLSTGVVTVIASVLAVQWFGPTGVAWGVSGGLILRSLVMWLLTRYYTGLWTHVGIPRWRDVKALVRRVG